MSSFHRVIKVIHVAVGRSRKRFDIFSNGSYLIFSCKYLFSILADFWVGNWLDVAVMQWMLPSFLKHFFLPDRCVRCGFSLVYRKNCTLHIWLMTKPTYCTAISGIFLLLYIFPCLFLLFLVFCMLFSPLRMLHWYTILPFPVKVIQTEFCTTEQCSGEAEVHFSGKWGKLFVKNTHNEV